MNTYFNDGIRIGHHSDEQVQHNGDVNDRVRSENDKRPKSRVRFHAGQVEGFEIHFAETRPKQSLYGLEHAVKVQNKNDSCLLIVHVFFSIE